MILRNKRNVLRMLQTYLMLLIAALHVSGFIKIICLYFHSEVILIIEIKVKESSQVVTNPGFPK